jgi:hypothetical protein
MESLRKQLFENDEPVREKVLDYCYGHEYPTGALVKLTEMTNASSGFDSMDKLKIVILALDIIEDVHLMGEVTGANAKINSYYNTNLTSLRQRLLDEVPRLYRVVSVSKKYENFNHSIKISYETKLKEKTNA